MPHRVLKKSHLNMQFLHICKDLFITLVHISKQLYCTAYSLQPKTEHRDFLCKWTWSKNYQQVFLGLSHANLYPCYKYPDNRLIPVSSLLPGLPCNLMYPLRDFLDLKKTSDLQQAVSPSSLTSCVWFLVFFCFSLKLHFLGIQRFKNTQMVCNYAVGKVKNAMATH